MKKIIITSLLTILTPLSSFSQTSSEQNIFLIFEKTNGTTILNQDYLNSVQNTVLNNIKISDFNLNRTQYFVIVDSNENQQNLMIGFWNSEKQLLEISNSASKVSTGDKNRKGYFTTPTGWFEQKSENGTYRALGTKNENGIRGIGSKGMRVWDFGWQKAYTGWLKNPELREIRMQMHATDPDYLEQRLGKINSQGCIRVISDTNKFIDNFSILDYNIQNSNPNNFVFNKNQTPVKELGSFVFVFNNG